jgi:hypothetical protein
MTQPDVVGSADERLKRLRVLAGSSVVGDDLKWLLEEYDRLQIDNRALADTAAHALNEKQSKHVELLNLRAKEIHNPQRCRDPKCPHAKGVPHHHG